MPSTDHDRAFEELKERLVTAPVLAYETEFFMETDASVQGLGAGTQCQADGKLHPIAYTSRTLNATEKRYGIMELETLAVVWDSLNFIIISMAMRSPCSGTTLQ